MPPPAGSPNIGKDGQFVYFVEHKHKYDVWSTGMVLIEFADMAHPIASIKPFQITMAIINQSKLI